MCLDNQYALEVLCFYTPEFSVLWRPFVVTYHPNLFQILYVAYCAIVFIYLAIPICGQIVSQILEKIAPFRGEHLDVKSWKM
jgi:hypothetical protein